jgi:hypothetical protein
MAATDILKIKHFGIKPEVDMVEERAAWMG